MATDEEIAARREQIAQRAARRAQLQQEAADDARQVGRQSEASRQRERATQVRMLAVLERVATVRFAREFDRLGRELGKLYRELGVLHAEVLTGVLQGHDARMKSVLDRLYADAGKLFGARIRTAVGKSAPGMHTLQKASQAENIFQLAMRQFIEGTAGDKIDDINKTTRRKIQGALSEIEETGEGEREGAKRIEAATGGAIGRARAAVIARTEGHTGSQVAAQIQIDQLGVRYFKRWVSVQDARTRDNDDAFDHRGANGQRVARGEKYEIKKLQGGVEKIDYPGDPKGSPGNVINCRCVSVFEVVRG